MNEWNFIRIYKSLANQEANKDDLYDLYRDLSPRVVGNENLTKFFIEDNPDSLGVAIAIDAVAHEIHKEGDQALQEIFPGANYSIIKSELDALSGMESSNEIRRFNRGYFTSILNNASFTFLEKQQVGMTTKEDIGDAIEEYKRLFRAGIASKAEILTLARYFPEDNKYRQEITDKNLETEDSEPLVVGGPASVELIDKEGHLITTEALKDAFDNFMANFRARNAQIFHSDVQIGWILPAYINKNGQVFKSGVDEKGLWAITEVRDDSKIADRVKEEIQKGNIQSYSIAGTATDTKNMTKGANSFTQVNGLSLAEITLCSKGVNQGAHFDILKSLPEDKFPVSSTSIVNSLIDNSPEGGILDAITNYSVVIDPQDSGSPSVVICADRRNTLTDEMQLSLQKMLPEGTPIVVKPLSLVENYIPMYKMSISSLQKDVISSTDPGVSTATFGGNGKSKKLEEVNKMAIRIPHPIKPEGRSLQGHKSYIKRIKSKASKINKGEETSLSLLNEWVEKHCSEHRQDQHKQLLVEYGFPQEVSLKDKDLPVVEGFFDPSIVNEAGGELTK